MSNEFHGAKHQLVRWFFVIIGEQNNGTSSVWESVWESLFDESCRFNSWISILVDNFGFVGVYILQNCYFHLESDIYIFFSVDFCQTVKTKVLLDKKYFHFFYLDEIILKLQYNSFTHTSLWILVWVLLHSKSDNET